MYWLLGSKGTGYTAPVGMPENIKINKKIIVKTEMANFFMEL
jgi:hypothetical protein